MKFAILVNEAPAGGQAAQSALSFAHAVIDKGHLLLRVFFYCDGIHNANRLSAPPDGERNLPLEWSDLAAGHGTDLVLCISAARRRGVREANLAPGFRISGLGLLVEAGIEADRLITFGG
jgi:tRNA 2-thiouridine synthesizing protein D